MDKTQDETGVVINLPRPAAKGPITVYHPELETFSFYLMERRYSEATIRSYVSVLNSGLSAFTASNAPEDRIVQAIQSMSIGRRVTFRSAWHLLYAWLAPLGYAITYLPKLAEGRPQGSTRDVTVTQKAIKLNPPLRCIFRGYGDVLFGFRAYLATHSFSDETIKLYFLIVVDALHHLEGDARCSIETLTAILSKAAKNYPYLDPTGVRFLRAWAHLYDYMTSHGFEVTLLPRPKDMRPKVSGLRAVTSADTEKVDTQDTQLSSPASDDSTEQILDEF